MKMILFYWTVTLSQKHATPWQEAGSNFKERSDLHLHIAAPWLFIQHRVRATSAAEKYMNIEAMMACIKAKAEKTFTTGYADGGTGSVEYNMKLRFQLSKKTELKLYCP